MDEERLRLVTAVEAGVQALQRIAEALEHQEAVKAIARIVNPDWVPKDGKR